MWIRLALLVPRLIVEIVQAVEKLKGDGGGAEKSTAVKEIVGTTVEAVEGISGKDIFVDSEIQRLTQSVIDAQVALANALTKRQAAGAGPAAVPSLPPSAPTP